MKLLIVKTRDSIEMAWLRSVYLLKRMEAVIATITKKMAIMVKTNPFLFLFLEDCIDDSDWAFALDAAGLMIFTATISPPQWQAPTGMGRL